MSLKIALAAFVGLLLALPSGGQVDVPSAGGSGTTTATQAGRCGPKSLACDPGNPDRYQRVQCDRLSCWCVDTTSGEEAEGTRVEMPELPLPCATGDLTMMMCDMAYYGFVYSKGSCVEKTMIVCSGGSPFPFRNKTTCQKAFESVKPCLAERMFFDMVMNTSAILSPQTYLPKPACDPETGDYAPLQCRDRDPRLAQECACVNPSTGEPDSSQAGCEVPQNPQADIDYGENKTANGDVVKVNATVPVVPTPGESTWEYIERTTGVDTGTFVGGATVLAVASLVIIAVYAHRQRTETLRGKMMKIALTGESVEMLPRTGYSLYDSDRKLASDTAVVEIPPGPPGV